MFKKSKPDYEAFAELMGNQFKYSIHKYNPKIDGIGHGYYFNNFIVVVKLSTCMARFILDRSDVFLQIAPLNSPPTARAADTKNPWTDVSILTSWLEDKGKTFKWFYTYDDVNLKDGIEHQLSKLDTNLKPYWDNLIGLYSNGGEFSQNLDNLYSFRDERAKISWKTLGWNENKNPQKQHKTVLGHFPEFAEVATDLRGRSSYFALEGKVWDALWKVNSGMAAWEVVKTFIDTQLDKENGEIVLATEARNPESLFSKEIKYAVKKLDM